MVKYNPAGYRNLLRFSSKTHLLVEGKDDKQLFKLLLDEFFDQMSQEGNIKIVIDSAEDLIDFQEVIGNREKVERICENISGTSAASKLVGFVDREFREFEFDYTLRDGLIEHKVIDRLVWSRGHSVENYFFDFSILRNPLRDLSATEWFDRALILFENFLEPTIRLACAASLVGKELERINLMKDSIHWSIIEFDSLDSPNILIRFDILEDNLINQKKISSDEASRIVEYYKRWLQKIGKADFRVVRWLCHGHIGLSFIWAVYSRCVYEVCRSNSMQKPEVEVGFLYGVKERNRFQSIASWWARKAFGNQCDYPIELLKLLEFPIP